MRPIVYLCLMASCFLNLLPKPVIAQPIETDKADQNAPEPKAAYWQQAQQLTAAQWQLLNRLDQAMVTADPNRVRAVRGQLTLHLIALDRFLNRHNLAPQRLCPNADGQEIERFAATSAGLDVAQAQLYCTLYAASRELAPLGAMLDRRVGMLTDRTSPQAAPWFNRRPESASFRTATPSETAPSEKMPVLPLLNLGRVSKLPIADAMPAVPPAVAPAEPITKILQINRQRLAQLPAEVPAARFTPPQLQAPSPTYKLNIPYPGEVESYKAFLALPQTGITRVLPVDIYQVAVSNRLAPPPTETYPWAIISERENGLAHKLALQVAGPNFQLVPTDLDYGFVVSLGDVPIADLTTLRPEQIPHATETLRFFYTYRPPTELAAIQVDRRRFITGKVGNFNLTEPLLSQVPAAVNQTYLLRSIQYKLPEFIRAGRELTGLERRFLQSTLHTPASDLLVAFRPVSRRADGSYTVLWRVLARFPDPSISDLEEYATNWETP